MNRNELAKITKRVFGTPEGRELLNYLRSIYCPSDLAGKDEAMTNRNIGAYSVVATLLEDYNWEPDND